MRANQFDLEDGSALGPDFIAMAIIIAITVGVARLVIFAFEALQKQAFRPRWPWTLGLTFIMNACLVSIHDLFLVYASGVGQFVTYLVEWLVVIVFFVALTGLGLLFEGLARLFRYLKRNST